MKKYFKIYISGFTGAKEIRNQLMAVDSAQEAETILDRSAR
jgi:tRNA-dihydrouridine synthase